MLSKSKDSVKQRKKLSCADRPPGNHPFGGRATHIYIYIYIYMYTLIYLYIYILISPAPPERPQHLAVVLFMCYCLFACCQLLAFLYYLCYAICVCLWFIAFALYFVILGFAPSGPSILLGSRSVATGRSVAPRAFRGCLFIYIYIYIYT